jgi:aspartate/methionine/tyrosine aminotransferase
LFLLAFILCNPGDEAVIARPCFPLARNALAAVRADIREVRLSFDQGYRLDLHDLRTTLSPRTKLVSLASPQNPSGVAIEPAALHETLGLMQEICPDAYLLVDETYREAAYANDPVAETAAALGPKVTSVASLSKCHGAPGLRIGWVITHDAALRRQLMVGKFNTIVSCARLDEALALKLLESRATILAAFCSKPGCSGPPPGRAPTPTMSNGCVRMPARSAACVSDEGSSVTQPSTASTRRRR